MNPILKKITSPVLQWCYKKYYSKPRPFRYKDIHIIIYPGVFAPQFTFSTKLLLNYMEGLDLKGKRFLELGCGSGIIALNASKKGAFVTASDINKNAISQLQQSAVSNQLELKTIISDLFNAITEPHYDYIFINPPYYPKTPQTIEEHAWYCGPHFEYFKKLFEQLPTYVASKSEIILILSENCDIISIRTIAHTNHLDLHLIKIEKNIWERHYLFRVVEK
ncbi:methyltransferase [Aestuariivivens sediminis]|uniref:methyltransferase n=1 Tax=Aestuariivivens sediminis TaxID=2913557 RepID=UPI001F55FFDE|nr:methyltransferase [Aestuariivivens sediminis]